MTVSIEGPKNDSPETQETDSMANSTAKDNYQIKYEENVFTNALMAIPRGTVKAFSFLSGFWGYSLILAPIGAAYSLGLGVEALFLAMPMIPEVVETGTPVQVYENRKDDLVNRRFIPKPGVNDGAKITRLLPIKQTYNLIGEKTPVPQFITKRLPADEQNIWDNPFLFLISFALCAAIQHHERKVLNPKKVSEKKREFDAANKIKKVQADPNSVWLAKHKERAVNNHGKKAVVLENGQTALVYGTEMIGFLASFKFSNVAWYVILIYTALTIVGFELFAGQFEKAEALR